MGKAKRKLMAARKACYASDKKERPPEVKDDPEYERQMREYHRFETSMLLRSRLMDYADEQALPLCEFLDRVNIDNFVKWILREA